LKSRKSFAFALLEFIVVLIVALVVSYFLRPSIDGKSPDLLIYWGSIIVVASLFYFIYDFIISFFKKDKPNKPK